MRKEDDPDFAESLVREFSSIVSSYNTWNNYFIPCKSSKNCI